MKTLTSILLALLVLTGCMQKQSPGNNPAPDHIEALVKILSRDKSLALERMRLIVGDDKADYVYKASDSGWEYECSYVTVVNPIPALLVISFLVVIIGGGSFWYYLSERASEASYRASKVELEVKNAAIEYERAKKP